MLTKEQPEAVVIVTSYDEAGRPRRPKPGGETEIDDDQTEAGDEQDRSERKKPERGRQATAQSQETGEQANEASCQEDQSRQGPAFRIQRLGDKDGHELEQRAAHRKAQPSDAHRVHQNERIRRGDIGGGVAIPGHHERQSDEEPGERHREVGHRPS